MALSRDGKQAQVTTLTEKMKQASSMMFAHYIGMSVGEVSDFRNKLREGEAEMKVAKKTLIALAAKEAGLPEISADNLDGPVACIFSFADPLSGAQISFKFGKDHDQVALVGGVFDGKVLTKEEAVEFAKMPGREELLGKFVGMIRSPLYSFAGVCSSPLSGFARGLQALADKGGVSPDDAPAAEPAAEAPKEEAKKEPTEEAPAEEKAEEPAPEAAENKAEEANEATSEEAPKEEASSDEAEKTES